MALPMSIGNSGNGVCDGHGGSPLEKGGRMAGWGSFVVVVKGEMA